jgi:hypothetical protein
VGEEVYVVDRSRVVTYMVDEETAGADPGRGPPAAGGLVGTRSNGGYFDQAHFSREFKDFTAHTPTEYLALRRRFPAEQGFPPGNGPMPAE